MRKSQSDPALLDGHQADALAPALGELDLLPVAPPRLLLVQVREVG